MMYLSDRAARAPAARLSTLAAALCLALAALGAGCVYRLNIQQGNFLDPKAVEQLSVGMTRSQVRYLLGTPEVPNAFDNDRWDYLFYYKHGRARKVEEQQISVYFEDDKVSRIERPRGGAQVASQPVPPAEVPKASTDSKAPTEALPAPPPPPSQTPEQSPTPPPPSPP
jgi:outer membrane protein assembly factor BamE